jgi:hypothetical protein
LKALYPAALGVLACTSDHMTQPELPSFTGSSTVTLVGAGDIAGCRPAFKSRLTARVVDSVLGLNPSARAFTAGDNAYGQGRAAQWKCYDETWGRFKTRTWFTIGNHELSEDTAGTASYNYILGTGVDSAENGRRGKLYHVHDHGAWRIYFLNSERNISEQRAWLKADMEANPRKCQLMVFHRPLYTSSSIPMVPARELRPWHVVFWRQRGDVVVAGHVHSYERTAVIRPDMSPGVPAEAAVIDPSGFQVFIEGGGGHPELSPFSGAKPYSQKRLKRHGVLKLTLLATSYRWERLDTLGLVVDRGSRGCR